MYLQKTITAMSRKQHIQLFAFPTIRLKTTKRSVQKLNVKHISHTQDYTSSPSALWL